MACVRQLSKRRRCTDALRVAKQCIAAAADDRGQGYTLERELGGELLTTTRTQELISAFLDKNKATKS